jgi:hypothetical protein
VGTRKFNAAARFALAAVVSTVMVSPADARAIDGAVSSSVLIEATPEVVWRAVHEERMNDPDLGYVKVLEHKGNRMLLEEQFVSVPILGQVTAVLQQHEEPFKRIDYTLIRSDKFKRLEGSWMLTPMAGGKHTLLELSSLLELGVPFSGPFVKNATQRKIDKRVKNVKHAAEREAARMAGNGKHDI